MGQAFQHMSLWGSLLFKQIQPLSLLNCFFIRIFYLPKHMKLEHMAILHSMATFELVFVFYQGKNNDAYESG